MTKVIKIRKGLDINLKGKAKENTLHAIRSDYFSIFPDDFEGLTPKIQVKAGDKVLAGSILFFDKNYPELKVVSPVSGEITEVNRGEKRKLLNIVIHADKDIKSIDYGKQHIEQLTLTEIKDYLSNAGIFPFFKQRPYDIIVNPQNTPRDIFISAFNSAPLAPDIKFILKNEVTNFQTGIDVLAKLTSGKVYLGIKQDCEVTFLNNAKNVTIVPFKGPHPSGNVGVQINKIKPINKGDIVWTINPADILFIGRLFNTGLLDMNRTVALTGSEVIETGYYDDVILGANINNLVKKNTTKDKELRYISGNVLTGKKIPEDGFLRALDNQITVIPEGREVNEFFGWASPGVNKFSNSKTFLSKLIEHFIRREYTFDARIKGGKRAIIMSNEYDQVFPMDIYPEYLLKAIIAFNIDKMEELGIYEVAPEDFALCEFVDTSKIEIQQIVRNGLNLLYNELNS